MDFEEETRNGRKFYRKRNFKPYVNFLLIFLVVLILVFTGWEILFG